MPSHSAGSRGNLSLPVWAAGGIAALAGVLCAHAQPVDVVQARAAGLAVYWEMHLPLEGRETVTALRRLDERLYAVTSRGAVFSVLASVGVVDWSRPLEAGGGLVLGVEHAVDGSGGPVLVTTPAGVWVLDRDSGEELSLVRLTGAPRGPATGALGLVYLGGPDQRLMCLDAPTGSLFWDVRTGGPVEAAPLLLPPRVVFASTDGGVYAVDAESKRFGWMYQTGGPVRARPMAADGAVLIASEDRFVYCVSAGDGSLRWRRQFAEPLREPPLPAGGKVYQVVGNVGLAAMDLADGRLLWQRADVVRFLGYDGRYAYVLGERAGVRVVGWLFGEQRAWAPVPAPGTGASSREAVYRSRDDRVAVVVEGTAAQVRVDGRFVAKFDSSDPGDWMPVRSGASEIGRWRDLRVLVEREPVLMAVDPETGATAAVIPAPAADLPVVNLVDDLVIVGGADGTIVALRRGPRRYLTVGDIQAARFPAARAAAGAAREPAESGVARRWRAHPLESRRPGRPVSALRRE